MNNPCKKLIWPMAVLPLVIAACNAQTDREQDAAGGDSSAAPAEIEQVFGRIDCTASERLRLCEGGRDSRVPTFDGVPLDVNVAFPAEGEPPFPLVVRMHGYSGVKEGPYLGGVRGEGVFTDYTDHGFAVMAFTARGRGESCGSEASRRAAPEACAEGWDHLGDLRTSVRDVQHLSGLLVDDGLVKPAIGVQGGSYGGGRSLSLAVLHDRMMLEDGSETVWTSPGRGIPMRIGAAVPFIAWADLGYALGSNGRHLDYAIADADLSQNPPGIMKFSIVTGLWRKGQQHFNAAPGQDPSIDFETWYEGNGTSGIDRDAAYDAAREYSHNHSSVGVPVTRKPAPTLIANGFTDDIFPVNEALRWTNRVRAAFPEAIIAELYGDFGHRRANQNSESLLKPAALAWFQRHLQGRDVDVLEGVVAYEQQCGGGFGGKHVAAHFHALASGEVRARFTESRSFDHQSENRQVSRLIDPPSGRSEDVPSDSCRRVGREPAEGTASFTLAPAAGGYTLIGSPLVIADIDIEAEREAAIVARLWDIGPDDQGRTLVTQGLYRPDFDLAGKTSIIFQLHANAWHFAPGHRAELQLLGRSTPYVKPPESAHAIGIDQLDLRLPVAEDPDNAGTVGPITERPLPEGMRRAPLTN